MAIAKAATSLCAIGLSSATDLLTWGRFGELSRRGRSAPLTTGRNSFRRPPTFLAGVLVLALAALAFARTPAAPPVVLISIDGLRPDYVLEADKFGLRIPNLRRLVLEGAHAHRVTGVLPTVTYPSHTTLVTGVSPARHGILQNHPFDPLYRNYDGWYWYAQDIQVPTLWDVASRAGLTTSNVDWPVTVGADITYNIPQYWRSPASDAPDDGKLARALATPGLLAEAEGHLGPYPSGYAYTVDQDVRRARFSAFLLETKRPRLHLCYFSGLDEEQHESGPLSPATFGVLERIDALVGQVRAAADRAAGGRAVVAVVSDHGFATTDRELDLNEALREAGLITLDGKGRLTAWKAFAWNAGGAAAIMLGDPRDEETRCRVEEVLRRLAGDPRSGIGRILDADEIRAAGGFPGAAFVVGLAPNFRLGSDMDGRVSRRVVAHGTHGLLASNPEMDAAFFLVGPGVPLGRDLGRIDMRDVAPTLAGRLGVALPSAEGRNLLD